jgi:hypothetical protein
VVIEEAVEEVVDIAGGHVSCGKNFKLSIAMDAFIQYEIKLTPDTIPISLPPYHASPKTIDAQLVKWFAQEVISM